MIKSTRIGFFNVCHFFSRKGIAQTEIARRKLEPSEKHWKEQQHEMKVYLENASPIQKARFSLLAFPIMVQAGLKGIEAVASEIASGAQDIYFIKHEAENLENRSPQDKINFAKQIKTRSILISLMNKERPGPLASLPYEEKKHLIFDHILKDPCGQLASLEIVANREDYKGLDNAFNEEEKENLLYSLAIMGLEKHPERSEIPFHKHIPVELHQEIRDIAADIRFEKIKAEIQQGTLVDIDKDLPSYALSKAQNSKIIKLILESTEELNLQSTEESNIRKLLANLNRHYFIPRDNEAMHENQLQSYKSFSRFDRADRIAFAWICIKKDPTLTDEEILPFQAGKLKDIKAHRGQEFKPKYVNLRGLQITSPQE